MVNTNSKFKCKINGAKIKTIDVLSPFYEAGLRKGDIIVSVNNEEVENDIDFSFSTACEYIEITFIRKGELYYTEVYREPGTFSGITFYDPPLRRCANRCVFCFVDQMPPGMRKSLYVKDEDYRLSFLNGNYITLTSLSKKMREKIVNMSLSPLYISVHATDPQVRVKLTGNKNAGKIMEQLHDFAKNGISFHTQLVIIPEHNDGKILEKSIKDLLTLGKSLLSVAVVPVGLTRYSNPELRGITKDEAKNIIENLSIYSDADKRENGTRRIFIADEFFIKADVDIPDTDYYEDYPQIENGVGLLRQLIDEWNNIKKRKLELKVKSNRILVLTSVSAYKYVKNIYDEANKLLSKEVFYVKSVKNNVFGPTVTVAGLLCAKDIIKVSKVILKEQNYDKIVIPSVMFNHNEVTLDGYSFNRMNNILYGKLLKPNNLKELF